MLHGKKETPWEILQSIFRNTLGFVKTCRDWADVDSLMSLDDNPDLIQWISIQKTLTAKISLTSHYPVLTVNTALPWSKYAREHQLDVEKDLDMWCVWGRQQWIERMDGWQGWLWNSTSRPTMSCVSEAPYMKQAIWWWQDYGWAVWPNHHQTKTHCTAG